MAPGERMACSLTHSSLHGRFVSCLVVVANTSLVGDDGSGGDSSY